MLFNGKSYVVVLINLNKLVGARAHQLLGWPHFVSVYRFESQWCHINRNK